MSMTNLSEPKSSKVSVIYDVLTECSDAYFELTESRLPPIIIHCSAKHSG